MCCQSFGYTLGKAEGYGSEWFHVIVQSVFASVFCANTIKSRNWGHTLRSYISIFHFRAGNPTLHSLGGPYTLFSLQRKKQPINQPKKKAHCHSKASTWNIKQLATLNHQDFVFNRIGKDHMNFESRLPENLLFQKYCKQETSLQLILPFISQIIPATILHSSLTAILPFPPWNHLQPLPLVAGAL